MCPNELELSLAEIVLEMAMRREIAIPGKEWGLPAPKSSKETSSGKEKKCVGDLSLAFFVRFLYAGNTLVLTDG